MTARENRLRLAATRATESGMRGPGSASGRISRTRTEAPPSGRRTELRSQTRRGQVLA